MQDTIKSDKGSTLLGVVILIVVATFVITGFYKITLSGNKVSTGIKRKTGNKYGAESAIHIAAKNVMKMVNDRNGTGTIQEKPDFDFIDIFPGGDYDRETFIDECVTEQSRSQLEEAQRILACTYLADKYEILPMKELDDVKVKIDSIERFDGSNGAEVNLSKTIADNYKIPKSTESPEVGNLFAERDIYQINLTAENIKAGSRVSLAARIATYGIPLHQFLILSNYDLKIVPWGASTVYLKGRVHTNERAGFGIADQWNHMFTISPLDFEDETRAVTSSKGIWKAFKYIHKRPDGSHDLHSYWKGPVRVETEENSYEKFYYNVDDNHLIHDDNTYEASDGYPTWWQCEIDPQCWADNHETTTGYYIEFVEVDAKHEDFDDRIDPYVDRIEPLWFERFNDPVDYIQLPDSSDSEKIKDKKLFYRTEVRVIRDETGALKSVDAEGNEITSGPFSTAALTLADDPVVRVVEKQFYDPRLGRAANAIILNVAQLNNLGVGAGQGIPSLYIGSENEPSGEIRYPAPNCNPAYLNEGFSVICRADDGSDCQPPAGGLCDPNTIGTFDAVIVKNAQEVPDGGFTLASNGPIMIQGDYNTVDKQPSLVVADNVTFLSNSWDPLAWDVSDPNLHPPVVTQDTTYNLAWMDGSNFDADVQMPLIENWGDHIATKHGSYTKFWDSKYFPPKAGDYVVHNWDRQGYRNYYDAPNWITTQDLTLASNPPPLAEKFFFVKLLSVEETESTLASN